MKFKQIGEGSVMRIFLLPVVLFFATGLLCVKLVGLFSSAAGPVLGVSTAFAQEAGSGKELNKATDAPGRLRENRMKNRPEAKKKEKLSDKELRAKRVKSQTETNKLFKGENFTERQEAGAPSKSDIAILQGLSKRRVILDTREKDLLLRENLLRAAEKRIEKRISDLSALESRISKFSETSSEINAKRFKKLVSLYEKMKPKEAAKIFNSLHMSVLAGVAERMKPQKIAAIMAKMEVKSAKRLTMELARRELKQTSMASSVLPRVSE